MERRRVTWWTRWPSTAQGPLWVGLHVDEAAGPSPVVGVEVWTVPPPLERTVPEATDGLEAPASIKAQDLGRLLRYADLLGAFRSALAEVDPDLAGSVVVTRSRQRVYGPDHYERVAGVYLRASRAPTQAVAGTWTVSGDTAKRWVRRARRLGMLGPPQSRPQPVDGSA